MTVSGADTTPPDERIWLEALLADRRMRVALYVALGVLLLFRLVQVVAGVTGESWAYDFAAYWQAGERVLAREPIYAAEQLAGPYSPQQPLLYLYPPFLAVLLAPFAAVFESPEQAMCLWFGLGVALTVGAVWSVAAAEGVTGRRERLFQVGAAFALAPVGFELVMGNVHMLLLGLLSGAWLALRRGSPAGDVVGGALIGAAALIKVFPLLLVGWLLLTGRWRAAGAAGAGGVVLALATVPVVGLGPWLDFPRVLTNLGPPQDLWSSLSPTSFLAELIDFGLARLIVAVAAVGLLVWSARRQSAPISFGVAVMLSILIAPTVYPHYLALSVLPLVLAAAHARSAAPVAFAYAGLAIGGQLALLDLAQTPNRILAGVGALAPLALLLRTDAYGARGRPAKIADRPRLPAELAPPGAP
ncbi:MAG TPA: glycosyltransferase family 87 protein [Candidatus Limnocylindria bacterium]|nr:glycosyltransferase family 87 protein [Candidatus Limnocylindria bacterium]